MPVRSVKYGVCARFSREKTRRITTDSPTSSLPTRSKPCSRSEELPHHRWGFFIHANFLQWYLPGGLDLRLHLPIPCFVGTSRDIFRTRRVQHHPPVLRCACIGFHTARRVPCWGPVLRRRAVSRFKR